MSEKRAVLVVEDSKDDIFFLRRAWRKAGVQVPLEEVYDGVEAIDVLRSNPPTHVLLDLKLPRKSGIEVLEWIRRTDPLKNLPVIVLTSSGEQPDVDQARTLGVDDYLIKPVHLPDLVELVQSIAGRWSLPTG